MLLAITIIGGAFVAWLILVTLFTPAIPYKVEQPVDPRSDHFVHVLESTCHTSLDPGNKVDVFTNGTAFYPAMLEAIRSATETVSLECYIFQRGRIADQFVEALAERARAGVRVRIVMDAIGSLLTFRRLAKPLGEAGCHVESYRRLRWYSLARLNNRTHRELLVVDGRVAFVGGAGIADWWAAAHDGKPMWRDMMARIEGPLVSDIQGVAAENWLECCGDILTDPHMFKPHRSAGTSPALVVKSSPADRATASRVLFQMLVECAASRILIATPYFLPDKAFRKAFARTIDRGVSVVVIVPGAHTDQRWVRLASRRMYGRLLDMGVRVFEYERGMTHVKSMLVDDLWSVIGTTNFDNRSFEHNDEVNVAIKDESVAARFETDFRCDLQNSREITLESWRKRPVWEKLVGTVAWILERQQ